ncbi:MAG: cupin domain-containing protein [Hyphomonadaceae bacterium]
MREQAAHAALMLDYAVGALGPAATILVETHLALRPAARRESRAAEAAGGVFLEWTPREKLAATAAAAGQMAKPAHPAAQAARALVDVAIAAPERIGWRPLLFGVEQAALPIDNLVLLRLRRGGRVPMHTHAGEELTLVLHGGFADQAGYYEPGDIAFADESVRHSPRVPAGGACICLAAHQGLRLSGLLGLIAPQWPRRKITPALQARAG